MSEWQSIETARKDIGIVWNGVYVGEAYYYSEEPNLEGWYWAAVGPGDGEGPIKPEPTHWMPLPPPPTRDTQP